MNNVELAQSYKKVRIKSQEICSPLKPEDYVVQPIVDVSPPKWHLGHTTWFFETFVLKPFFKGYKEFDNQYNFVFNSYYETVGARVIRTDRGNLSRPTVSDVYEYREFVDKNMLKYLDNVTIDKNVSDTIILGLNHEQQHQELLITDIKYILGHNPLFPAISQAPELSHRSNTGESAFKQIPGGVYEIGFN